MVVQDFLKTIQEYYGMKYNHGVQIEMIYKYLEKKSSEFLICLLSTTIQNFSGQYKTLPDIAIFNQFKAQVFELMDKREMERQQDLNRQAIPENTEEEEDRREDIVKMFEGLKKKYKWNKKIEENK